MKNSIWFSTVRVQNWVQLNKLPKAETLCCKHAQAGFLSFCHLLCAAFFYCILESNHTRCCCFSSLIIVISFVASTVRSSLLPCHVDNKNVKNLKIAIPSAFPCRTFSFATYFNWCCADCNCVIYHFDKLFEIYYLAQLYQCWSLLCGTSLMSYSCRIVVTLHKAVEMSKIILIA